MLEKAGMTIPTINIKVIMGTIIVDMASIRIRFVIRLLMLPVLIRLYAKF